MPSTANLPDQTELLARAQALLERLEARWPAPQGQPDDATQAHRWSREDGFVPIARPRVVQPDELLNIDRQSAVLMANTEQFLAGKPANHALLWGARGTGKSSLIRSLLSRYADTGLRLIEIDAADLRYLPRLLAGLKPGALRYILFADDLSFDAADPSYTALKALLDGSLAATPEHVLIYATSNRRHLMPESMTDNLDTHIEAGELHPGEAVEEKISLSERFGVWLAFHPFSQDEYLACLRHWLTRLGVESTQQLEADGLRWALRRGARNGRVAYQFAVSCLAAD